MSALATATVAALLFASPSNTDADRLAANGGFLLGNAQRCGIADERVAHARGLIRELIVAAARDADEQEDAIGRFSAFFLVTAMPEKGKGKLVASCPIVARELKQLEQHQAAIGGPDGAPGSQVGPSAVE